MWPPLRALFPSWNFFDDSGHAARLSYRVSGPDASFGDWRFLARGPARRNAATLLLNARENLAMAEDSLVDQLLAELESRATPDAFAIERSVAYGLLQNLVLKQVHASGERALRYQFKISVDSDDALLSAVHDVE